MLAYKHVKVQIHVANQETVGTANAFSFLLNLINKGVLLNKDVLFFYRYVLYIRLSLENFTYMYQLQ